MIKSFIVLLRFLFLLLLSMILFSIGLLLILLFLLDLLFFNLFIVFNDHGCYRVHLGIHPFVNIFGNHSSVAELFLDVCSSMNSNDDFVVFIRTHVFCLIFVSCNLLSIHIKNWSTRTSWRHIYCMLIKAPPNLPFSMPLCTSECSNNYPCLLPG